MEFDFSVITDHWRFLGMGVLVTLALSIASGLTSLVVGFGVALARLYGPAWLRPVVILYVDSMRAVPVLVVLVWTFFALPMVAGITLPPFWAALVGLTVHLAAYAAEIVRAGIESVRPGQTRAALALGMGRGQILRRIVLPQAVVRMLPAFGSLLSVTIKDTAIASVIAVPELMRESETVAGQSFQPIEVYSFAMLVYFVILVVFWAFYVLPILTGLALSPLATGLLALVLNVTAYNAETFRAGINSIRKGQVEAALALGMTRAQALRRIVLPQAVRRITPVLASTWVSLFKDTSLVSVIAVTELAYVAMQVRAQTFRVLEMLTAMAVIYWLLGYPQAKLVDWIERRYAVKE